MRQRSRSRVGTGEPAAATGNSGGSRPSAATGWLGPVILLLLLMVLASSPLELLRAADPDGTAERAERRGLKYLSAEVPGWRPANGCYSCHNNGDGVRALLLARRLKREVPPAAYLPTIEWLEQPDRWRHNGGEGEFSDKRLANIHFASALAAACEAQALERPEAAARRAVALVLDSQADDGSWPVDAGGVAGSPLTYGRHLATVQVRWTLATLDGPAARGAIDRADRWLAAQRPKTVLDAAALLLHAGRLRGGEGTIAGPPREACFQILRRGQAPGGGWGPRVSSPPEVFDTALVLLALAAQPAGEGPAELIAPGRRFLVQRQQGDGSWDETTRPAGSESYAQRVSTTAWATMALMMTHPGR